MNTTKILLYFLLMAAIGVAIGFFVVYYKRRTIRRFASHNVERLKTIERRWNSLGDDLKLVRDLGADLADRFANATPQRIEEINSIARKFESAWFRTKNESKVSPGTNMMETVTTYELEKLLGKLESNLALIFDQKQ